MTQDRKAPLPIPKVKKDDAEDVSWALSTAEAMWGRGDRADALKWIRRAAEAASEAEHDDRALELARAAADLTPLVGRSSGPPPLPPESQPPPKSSVPPRPGGQLRPSQSPPRPGGSTTRASQSPPKPIQAQTSPRLSAPGPSPRLSTPGRPSSAGSATSGANATFAAAAQPSPAKGVTALRAAAISLTGTRASAKAPLAPAVKAQPEPRAPSDRPAPKRQPSGTNEAKRKRSSRPPAAEVEFVGEAPELIVSGESVEDDLDAWPTQTIPGRDAPVGFGAPHDRQVTRVNVPAYQEAQAETDGGAGPKPSQAVRVVVWRSPDGVRVATHGATVSAITVDAILVALDPTADLAAWLADK